MAQLRLTRSNSDKIVTGVCGGLSSYLGVDATIVRLAFILLGLASGIGVPLYLILTFVVPQEDSDPERPLADVVKENVDSLGDTVTSSIERARHNPSGRNMTAFVLIALGLFFMLNQFGWIHGGIRALWPFLLVAVGLTLAIRWWQQRNGH